MEILGLVLSSLIGVAGLLICIIGIIGTIVNRLPNNKDSGAGYDGFDWFLFACFGFTLMAIGVMGWVAIYN